MFTGDMTQMCLGGGDFVVVMPIEPDYSDPFAPPVHSRLVRCLHCDEVYQSSEMVYEQRGYSPLWFCKNRDCNGAGYGCDISEAFI